MIYLLSNFIGYIIGGLWLLKIIIPIIIAVLIIKVCIKYLKK